MPELPEVESFRRYLEKTSLEKTIDDILVKNDKILQDISINDLMKNLISTKLVKTMRWGKYLFIQTDKGIWLTMHFGMSGSLFYFHHLNEQPSHCRLLIKFEGDNYLCFNDQRLFGRIGLVQEVESFIKKHHLGPDVLAMNKEEFIDAVSGKRSPIKTILMKQELFAGIGNEYSDEILFQGKINPAIAASDLSREQLAKLFVSVGLVLNAAIKSKVEDKPYPDNFLLHSGRKKRVCPRCGSKISCQKFSGRTGCFCQKCQAV